MPKCKNDKTTLYTGKEKSPKGLGYSAKKVPIGTKKQGKDKKMWIVKKRTNGVKLWSRFSSKKVTKKKTNSMKGGAIGVEAATIIKNQIELTTTTISDKIDATNQQIRDSTAVFKDSIESILPVAKESSEALQNVVTIVTPLRELLTKIMSID